MEEEDYNPYMQQHMSTSQDIIHTEDDSQIDSRKTAALQISNINETERATETEEVKTAPSSAHLLDTQQAQKEQIHAEKRDNSPPKKHLTKHQRIQAFFESSKIYPTLRGDVEIDDELT